MTVLTVVVALASNAQSIQFGVKAGVNFASLEGEDLGDVKMRTSFHAGGAAEFMIADKFSLQPELMYSSQGAKASDQAGAINISSIVRFNYLNLPVMAKFYPIEGLSVQVGPQIGLLLSAKAEIDVDGIVSEEDFKDDLKDTDFGVNFGLGYKLSSGLFFDARYNLGLTNIDGDENTEIKNNVIQISLGFLF